MEEKETFGIPSSKFIEMGKYLTLVIFLTFLTVPAYSLKLEVELSMQNEAAFSWSKYLY